VREYEFDWIDRMDVSALAVWRDETLHGTAAAVFGNHRGMPLQKEDERRAALAQVGMLGRHRAVAG
jgi:hypothetical protein